MPAVDQAFDQEFPKINRLRNFNSAKQNPAHGRFDGRFNTPSLPKSAGK
jgi:hypothetical protein